MSNRKLFVWFMLLALVIPVALTACGGAGDIEQAVEEAAQQVEEAVEEAAPAVEEAVEEVKEAVEEAAPAVEEAVEEVVEEVEEAVEEVMVDYDTDLYGVIDDIDLDGAEITYWHRYDGGSRLDAIDEICANFNAANEYGITVECLPIGHYGIIYETMIPALATGDLPDLVVAYQNQAASYQIADGLVAVDPYMTHPVYGLTEEEQADTVQSFIDGDRLPQFNNEVFGFPVAGRSMEVLFVNTDWLTELGYDAPPQTPEEFAEMACAAAEQPFSKNESDFSTGMEVSTDASAFAAWVFARGGVVFDQETGTFTYNTQEAIDAMTMLQDLNNQGCVAQIAERYGDQTDFGNGKTLFTTSSTSGLVYYGFAVDGGDVGGFEWTVAPIPYTGDTPVQDVYGGSTSIVRTDPQSQLASWLFLKYMSSPEVQAKWVPASTYFPARASAMTELSDFVAENPNYGIAFELLQSSVNKVEAPVAGYDTIRNDHVSPGFTAIVFDGADIAETLAAMEVGANEEMEEAAP